MINKHHLLALLSRHIGAKNGVRARDLAHQLGCSERELRKLISELIIDEHVAVAGMPSTGYFIPADARELEHTIEFHKHRALHELLKASRLSGIPILELAGQLRLKS